MDIVFSVNNNEKIMILPVVPVGMPEINSPQENEEFDGINGKLNLQGNMGLKTVSISSFFPNKKYSFAKAGSSSNGWDYVSFFETYRKKKLPFRIVVTTSKGKKVLNIPVTVDNFSYSVDKIGDIPYTLELKEYPIVTG